MTRDMVACYRIQIIGERRDNKYVTMHVSRGGQKNTFCSWGQNKGVCNGINIKELDGRWGEGARHC